MTTTRINHTGHNHPNTTAARTACRNELRAADAAIDTHYAMIPVADSVFAPYRPITPNLLGTPKCRCCGNIVTGSDIVGPNVYGACGPTYCHYADAN